MANASLEDCQLFAQSEILQRDLFIAAKDQEDHPKKREDCVQHEAESVSASSLKINRFRNRWNSGEAHVNRTEDPLPKRRLPGVVGVPTLTTRKAVGPPLMVTVAPLAVKIEERLTTLKPEPATIVVLPR